MGQSIEHRHRASRNEQTLHCLLENNNRREHGEWIVPIAGFKAIHLVEAYCATAGQHFVSHEARLDFVKRVVEFTREDREGESAYLSFHFLTMLCQHAMEIHNGIVMMPSDEQKKFFDGLLKQEVIEKHLRKVESFANHHGITTPPSK